MQAGMQAMVATEPSALRQILLKALVEVQMLRDVLRKEAQQEAAPPPAPISLASLRAPAANPASTGNRLAAEVAMPQACASPTVDQAIQSATNVAQPGAGSVPTSCHVFANLLFQQGTAEEGQDEPADDWGTWVSAQQADTTTTRPRTPRAPAAAAAGPSPATLSPADRDHYRQDQHNCTPTRHQATPTTKSHLVPLTRAMDNKANVDVSGTGLGNAGKGAKAAGGMAPPRGSSSPVDDVWAGGDQRRGRGGAPHGTVPLVYSTTATVNTLRSSQGFETGALTKVLDAQHSQLASCHLRGNALYDMHARAADNNDDSYDAWEVHRSTRSFEPGMLLRRPSELGGPAEQLHQLRQSRESLAVLRGAASPVAPEMMAAGGSPEEAARRDPGRVGGSSKGVSLAAAAAAAAARGGPSWLLSDISRIPSGTVSKVAASFKTMSDNQPAVQPSGRSAGARGAGGNSGNVGGVASKLARPFNTMFAKAGQVAGNILSGPSGAQAPHPTALQRTTSEQGMRRGHVGGAGRAHANNSNNHYARPAGGKGGRAPMPPPVQEVDLRDGAAERDWQAHAQWEATARGNGAEAPMMMWH